jgi:hypothetical protein
MTANESFYMTFHVEPKDTEKKIVYELGNGQWNIPALQKLLKDILPKHTFFKGFEVDHDFPTIGHKIMILNARQIHVEKETATESFAPIILLAMEDITEMMGVAEKMKTYIKRLEEEMDELKKKL